MGLKVPVASSRIKRDDINDRGHAGVDNIGPFVCSAPRCPSPWCLIQKIINFSDGVKALSDTGLHLRAN